VDWATLQQRYLRDEWPIRFGNLGSTLARIASAVSNPNTRASVPNALRESQLMMEWNLHSAPSEVLLPLGPMQAELGLWQQSWSVVEQSPALHQLLARRARTMSDQVLELSGLLNQP